MIGLLIALVVLQALTLLVVSALVTEAKEIKAFVKSWGLDWLRRR